VDDDPPDDDTTYNSSSTATDQDSFTFGALPGGITATVKALQVLLNVRKDDAGTRTVGPFLRISATDYNGDGVNVGDSYFYQNIYIWEENPNTSSAFTVAEINALEAGYELTA